MRPCSVDELGYLWNAANALHSLLSPLFSVYMGCVFCLPRLAGGNVGCVGQLQHHSHRIKAALQHAARRRRFLGKLELRFVTGTPVTVTEATWDYFSNEDANKWVQSVTNDDFQNKNGLFWFIFMIFDLCRPCSPGMLLKCCPCWIKCPRDTVQTPSSTFLVAVQP